MPEAGQSPKLNYLVLILTGVISLFVGVGSGLLLKFFTDKPAKLVYDTTALQTFPGQSQRIGIVAVRISNVGKREVEDLVARVTLGDAQITESSVDPSDIPKTQSKQFVELRRNFLNPGESVSIQLLVQPTKETLDQPKVDVRGKGAVGERQAASAGDSKLGVPELAMTSGITIATMAALTITTFMRKAKGRTGIAFFDDFHGGDQRDVMAFLLSSVGLREQAEALRTDNREWSYWSLADDLVDKGLAGDSTLREKLIRVLERCTEYTSSMSSVSKRIVELGIARLALADNKTDLALRHLEAASPASNPLIMSRVRFDDGLKALMDVRVGPKV